MNDTLRNLFELQTLEFDETIQPDTEERIAGLRARIPDSILGHYDRLGYSGKKGVAILRNQVCTGCHLQVPLHVVMDMKHGDNICLCENCRRYLVLQEEVPHAASLPVPPHSAKPGRKHLAHAH